MVTQLGVEFDADFKELQRELQDEDFTTTVNLDSTQRGGDGGSSFATTMLGAEGATDIMSGAGGPGILGKLTGSLSMMTVMLGAAVGFLALLEPVQQALSFIMRQFELLIVPFLSAMRPLIEQLQTFAVQLIKFFRNPQEFLASLGQQIMRALTPLVNGIISGLNMIPGVRINPIAVPGQPQNVGQRSAGTGNTGQQGYTPLRDMSDVMVGPVGSMFVEPFLAELSDEGKKEKQRNKQDWWEYW